MSDKISLSGFGNTNINGTYTYLKDVDGYAAYRKDSTHEIIYSPSYYGYCLTPSYYVLENKQISGGIPQWKPVARLEGNNIEATGWITMTDITSGEQAIGSTVFDNDSSSSSSSSSVDSSSSSSSSS
jgi:hypothetical protein